MSNLMETIKEWGRWHHLNEMAIAAGRTPSDSEIDFEVIAWGKIIGAVAVQPIKDEAKSFESAGWYWRTMDPDDSGDTPEEAIDHSGVGHLVVCEIASGFTGPTRYGFIATVLDADGDETDETEFLHFATQVEALEAATARKTAIDAADSTRTSNGGA